MNKSLQSRSGGFYVRKFVDMFGDIFESNTNPEIVEYKFEDLTVSVYAGTVVLLANLLTSLISSFR